MADKRISELPTGTPPLDGTELVPVVKNGVTVHVTTQNIADRGGGGGGGGGGNILRIVTFVAQTGPLSLPILEGYLLVPVACTIVRATLLTNGGTGSCVVDVRKKAYSSFPPGGGDSICGSNKPTISSGIKAQDGTLTGWTTSVAANDVLAVVLESTSVFTSISLQIELAPT